MVLAYICCCVRVATKPCKYFQLNARFFDSQIGIFSKLQLDRLIPPRWRLTQFRDDGVRMPARYPVFVKPEWSQNAAGVHRADHAAQLQRIRAQLRPARVAYLIQEAALERHEYEIFSIPHHLDARRYAVLSVTEARNSSAPKPINSIHNPRTRYVEITACFSAAQVEQIWAFVRRLGDFKISRVSVCADSPAELARGNFHVIEVNLFLPMPINLLDNRYSWRDRMRRVPSYMMRLALVTKHRDKRLASKPVFIKSMLYHRRRPRSRSPA